MRKSSKKRPFLLFGQFQVALDSGELFTDGQKVFLQQKPFELLAALLKRSGQIVKREELHRILWPEKKHGDFDHTLNVAAAKLRAALSDSVENPRYIETVPSRGYRFVAPIRIGKKDQRRASMRRKIADEAQRIRLAVLPFANLRKDEDLESTYWADGLTEEIVTTLGHLYPKQLGVVSRSSTLKYRHEGDSIAHIGRELNVHFVLLGTVRSSHDRTHVTARLVRVADQTHCWADSYDFTSGDTLTLQCEVARNIAQALSREFSISQVSMYASSFPRNGQAYHAYLRGRYYQSRRTEGDLRKSITFFERASQLDSNYAPALTGLAGSKLLLGSVGYGGGPPRDSFPEAKQLALKSLEINSTTADGYVILALVQFLYEWKGAEAERSLQHAFELNPSDPTAPLVYSYFLGSKGRYSEAIEYGQKARSLDPLSPAIHVAEGVAHYFAGEYDTAIEVFENSLHLQSTFGNALIWSAIAYNQKSLGKEAIARAERARRYHPDNPTILAWLGEIYATNQATDKAYEILNELNAMKKRRYVSPFDYAIVYAGLRDVKVLKYLEKAFRERSPLMVLLLKQDSRFRTFQSNTAYRNFLKRIECT